MGQSYTFRLPDHLAVHANTKINTVFNRDKTEYFRFLVRKDAEEKNPVIERQTAEYWLQQALEQRESLLMHLQRVDNIILELDAKIKSFGNDGKKVFA